MGVTLCIICGVVHHHCRHVKQELWEVDQVARVFEIFAVLSLEANGDDH